MSNFNFTNVLICSLEIAAWGYSPTLMSLGTVDEDASDVDNRDDAELIGDLMSDSHGVSAGEEELLAEKFLEDGALLIDAAKSAKRHRMATKDELAADGVIMELEEGMSRDMLHKAPRTTTEQVADAIGPWEYVIFAETSLDPVASGRVRVGREAAYEGRIREKALAEKLERILGLEIQSFDYGRAMELLRKAEAQLLDAELEIVSLMYRCHPDSDWARSKAYLRIHNRMLAITRQLGLSDEDYLADGLVSYDVNLGYEAPSADPMDGKVDSWGYAGLVEDEQVAWDDKMGRLATGLFRRDSREANKSKVDDERAVRVGRITAWIRANAGNEAALRKGRRTFWRRVLESRGQCAKTGRWWEVYLTKAQVNLVFATFADYGVSSR